MYGHHSRYRAGSSANAGGGGPWGTQGTQRPAPPPNAGFSYHSRNFPFQNPALSAPVNPFLQNPNILLQNPNYPIGNLNIELPNAAFQPNVLPPKSREAVERVDLAVVKARRNLLDAGETVSAWKVSQSALLALHADSWESLGFRMQEIPSLHRLMVTEGKINAFIHCFVGVQRITSLYDLEVEICKNEGVEQFEELELGPLVRHPLIVHYFSVSPDATRVFKITSGEIISCLSEFMDNRGRKDIKAEDFLDFLSKKQAVMGRENLGVRIQSLGMHISFMQDARKIEDTTLKKCLEAVREKSNKKSKKRPLLSLQKKQLDERFTTISQRMQSFSSVHEDFRGKHIRFISSSSEDDDSDDYGYGNKKDDRSADSHCKASSQNNKSCDRVSSCPYPSATEEMTRLGLKSEANNQPYASGGLRHNESCGPVKKKRKSENSACAVSNSPNLLEMGKVKEDILQFDNGSEMKELNNLNKSDISLDNDFVRMFITTWKEACREHVVAEVFERMLQFYDTKTRQRKRMKSMFLSFPCIGLLNVAVMSIKCGMWDSIYDAFPGTGQHGMTSIELEKYSEYESIDVEPSEKDAPATTEDPSEHIYCVTVDDIISKITAYFELDHDILYAVKSSPKNKFVFLRKLFSCKNWLMEQFSVREFTSLGHGEFLMFLEKHASLLPSELYRCLIGDLGANSPLEVCMLQQQLVVLLSQASNSVWENETISKQNISVLLKRQFPLVCFKILENGSVEYLLDIISEQKSNVISNSVLFSSTLLGVCCNEELLAHSEEYMYGSTKLTTDISQRLEVFGSVTSKDAIEVLRRAPMLSDLNSWSHWDILYAPTFGPLVEWLLSEVNIKELQCLVTKDGKVIRIDSSATVDSFLEAFLQGSSFRTAVKLLSLFSSFGGNKHVPLSLLKSQARLAFEVLLKNCVENVDANDSWNVLMHHEALCRQQKLDEDAMSNSTSKLCKSFSAKEKAVPVASTFILECLGHLPSEFRGFATDVLLSGLRSVIKDAPSAVLCACKKIEQRLMLHDVGLFLGIVEWIDDYHLFCSSTVSDSCTLSGCLGLKALSSELSAGLTPTQDSSENFPCRERNMTSVNMEEHIEEFKEVCHEVEDRGVSGDRSVDGSTECFSALNKQKDAANVIESIRREEFGLDPNLSDLESSMLKKQHARLGRALHCLSQELYSQDSHFLLELVQNADDNIYSETVEPTLMFLLQETNIVVLNNEQGFSAQNIRALCDVGNSTKKGSTVGYIGQKGIGFKSVFRVTDAPEIHSNGFHVKFDISEGQIGFVLPTVIPPCDVGLFRSLVSGDVNRMDDNCWNTCIVLPFRTKVSKDFVMNSIISMFSDLHPSLLLFLHRLKCIKFRNVLNDSLIIMRKEIMGDGIIKVSRGKEKMTWFVASQKLRTDAIRSDVQTTEIAIAFTLQETVNGDYNAHLEQQPVFAFLPLRTYGLKFILQGDFVLPSSREEVDGDSPWNQWLLSEFPHLFVDAEKDFCALPCFRENPGKAVAAYMSFVPLMGEVHGFFSILPRMIISKLRMSNCLLVEGKWNEWVPPCKVLRNWTEQARSLLPDNLLHKHLGLGFLDKDICLPDVLARSLGIEEYGPKILLQIMQSLCRTDNGLKSMGLGWLCSWLSALCTMILHSSMQTSLNYATELDIVNNLRKIPFIPLSNGSYGSVDEGAIWLHFDNLSSGSDGEYGLDVFPNVYAKLRTVSPLFFAAASDGSCVDVSSVENLTMMLHRVGVQQLTAHEIVKVHILPALSEDAAGKMDENLMTEYLAFVMVHLQSNCHNCQADREYIISELHTKAFILTSHGYKRPAEVSIHFSKEFGNPIDISKLISVGDLKWHEVDIAYLKHPITEILSCGILKWREFFKELGITDFVHVVQVEKSANDIHPTVLKNMMLDGSLNFLGAIVKDWESPELVHLLSILSSSVDKEKCKYLLEVLDTLWDDYFGDKVMGYYNLKSNGDSETFPSSFIRSICDVKWVASSMDDELHYPKDLFCDSDTIYSIFGVYAPNAVPKVRSGKLLSDIGFKTQLTLDDALEILHLWRRSKTPFKASITQMSKFYTFIWDEITSSKLKIMEEFHSRPFIFVPFAFGLQREDVVSGLFLSPEEVCWHDPTGCVEKMKEIHSQNSSISDNSCISSKSLCNIYPSLHSFFVTECGVHETPSFSGYLQLLRQFSVISLPSQTADVVFRVFLEWSDGLKSRLPSSEDIAYLKECLLRSDFTVLPTVQDKWVSLHPSFGIVCWCDDENLRKEFKHLDNIDFLYFGGALASTEKEIVGTRVSVLMQTLGIPALSEVVTREAIYYGPGNSGFKASLVNWALPYAQRYIYNAHPDKYHQLKLSGFESLNQLQIVVVEKLFYKNVVKRCDIASHKRFECNCLLQGNILYATQESDSHSIFLELSRLFFGGIPELHLANFLHMITTMAESGSTEAQTEFFILNSQKVRELPPGESVWSLCSPLSFAENDQSSHGSTIINEKNPSKSKRKARINSHWPPADWKTAPGFGHARSNGFRTRAVIPQPSSSSMEEDDSEDIVTQTGHVVPLKIDSDWTIRDDSAAVLAELNMLDTQASNKQSDHSCYQIDTGVDMVLDPVIVVPLSDDPGLGSSKFGEIAPVIDDSGSGSFKFGVRYQLSFGTPNAKQALLTGRVGELVAFKYFSGIFGKEIVKWVNKDTETGLPYDIVIGDKENSLEFVEVKATKSARKDWFIISMREWLFAVDKGDSFSIAHVVLSGNDAAKVTIFKNPAKLCQQSKLQLVMMPRLQKEHSTVS